MQFRTFMDDKKQMRAKGIQDLCTKVFTVNRVGKGIQCP